MSITKFAQGYFRGRQKAIEAYTNRAEEIQNTVFHRLVNGASETEWGRKFDYKSIKDYKCFSERVPVQTYDDIKGCVDRMRHGERNVLWKGAVKWYAKSSGTTNDKSKFIPVSVDGLKRIHYLGGKDSVALYFAQNPSSRLFDGRSLILGGSHASNYDLSHSLVGDLSAILIENINPIVNLLRVPSKKMALMSDFEQKRDAIARYAMNKNVTNISGVPSWMLSVIKRILELGNTNNLLDIWPNLEVFFHGGVAFTPYKEQYKQIVPSRSMHYVETYNASEGFFGIQNDPSDSSMLLMIDYDVLYEFIPLEEIDLPSPHVIPLCDVEIGRNYAMVITTSCGLWRYLIGDTVKFTQKDPYKFIISGRTKHFINAFGEELMVDNAEKGLAQACNETGAQVLEYTAAPVFMDVEAKCRHQWLIEFAKEPDSLQHFAEVLDNTLQKINSDYEAKRHKDITLQQLEIVEAKRGLFDQWLKGKGKLGGQHKIPRLSNTRDYMDEMLTLNQ